MLFNHQLYTIQALSNLHAGSGDANYSVVDNEIQRDATTGLPNIHSSSLKGALREFARHTSGEGKLVRDLFGSEVKDDQKEAAAGKVKFYEARLLALPVRSDVCSFFLAFSPTMAADLIESCQTLQIQLDDSTLKALKAATKITKAIVEGEKEAILEDLQLKGKPEKSFDFAALHDLIGPNLAIIPDEEFKDLAESLPVIARNQLENGESKNLFYEEVLPRQSRLWFTLGVPSDRWLESQDSPEFHKHLNRFTDAITGDTVQIGANASVGYGLCKVKKVSA